MPLQQLTVAQLVIFSDLYYYTSLHVLVTEVVSSFTFSDYNFVRLIYCVPHFQPVILGDLITTIIILEDCK